jgi:hypothetical protein
MFVFVQDAAEPVVSSYVEPGDPVRVGERSGQRVEWHLACVRERRSG